MNEDGLKPCPFCGSSELVLDNLVDEDDYFVHCSDCHIQQIANYTKDGAIKRWNTRAERPQSTDAKPSGGVVNERVSS